VLPGEARADIPRQVPEPRREVVVRDIEAESLGERSREIPIFSADGMAGLLLKASRARAAKGPKGVTADTHGQGRPF